MGAIWNIAPAAEDGLAVQVDGPIRRAGPWRIVPVEGDIVRILMPSALFEAWLDVRLRRGGAGAVEALEVNGGRARGLVFTRAA